MPAFDPSRLSNLYKPAIILISTYVVVNLIGFLVQHDFVQPGSSNSIPQVNVHASEYIVFEEKVVSPAPPEVKIHPKKKTAPSGESINPQLP